jgi:hypothetical protein
MNNQTKTGQSLPYTSPMMQEACVLLEQDNVVAGSVKKIVTPTSLDYKEWNSVDTSGEADMNPDITILP